MARLKVWGSSFLALVSTSLGIVGLLGWCCTITGAAVLSFLGLASLGSFLFYGSKRFFGAAVIFALLAIVFYIKYRRTKVCAVRKK
jgi:hypothetical protein